jgi:hypothetical protein
VTTFTSAKAVVMLAVRIVVARSAGLMNCIMFPGCCDCQICLQIQNEMLYYNIKSHVSIVLRDKETKSISRER